MVKKTKLYVLDPEGVLFKQFSKKDIEKLNIIFARKLDTLLTKANMKAEDSLLVDSENVHKWENGNSLSDQLPEGMKLFATTVGGGKVIRIGNPIDISKLYKKIDEQNSFVGQFLDEEPDRVKRQQSIDAVLNIKDKNRYKHMDNIIAEINNREPDEVIMKEWNDPNKDLEIELDETTIGLIDKSSDISSDIDGEKVIKLDEINILDTKDDDLEIPFDLEIEDNSEMVIDEDNSEMVIDEDNSEMVIDEDNSEFEKEYLNNIDEVDYNQQPSLQKVSKKVIIPYRTIKKKNLHLGMGDTNLIQEGSDGWVENGKVFEPVDEIIEIGPDIISDIPFEVERIEVPYLKQGQERIIQPGENGRSADNTVIKEPQKQLVLVGTLVLNPDNNKKNNSNSTKRRRTRSRRKKKNSVPKNKTKDGMNQQDEDEARDSLNDNDIMVDDSNISEATVLGDNLIEESDNMHPNSKQASEISDANKSFLDELLGNTDPEHKEEIPVEEIEKRSSIDDIIKRLQEG